MTALVTKPPYTKEQMIDKAVVIIQATGLFEATMGARDISLSTKSLLGFLWANFNVTYSIKITSSRTIQIYRSPEMKLRL